MKTITRRGFLVACGAATLGAVTFRLSTGFRSWIMRQIEYDFGTPIAETEEVSAFVDELMTYLKGTSRSQYWKSRIYFGLKPDFIEGYTSKEDHLRKWVIDKFLSSTNYIVAQETGGEFKFLGIFDPYLNPCSNQLSAFHSSAKG